MCTDKVLIRLPIPSSYYLGSRLQRDKRTSTLLYQAPLQVLYWCAKNKAPSCDTAAISGSPATRTSVKGSSIRRSRRCLLKRLASSAGVYACSLCGVPCFCGSLAGIGKVCPTITSACHSGSTLSFGAPCLPAACCGRHWFRSSAGETNAGSSLSNSNRSALTGDLGGLQHQRSK